MELKENLGLAFESYSTGKIEDGSKYMNNTKTLLAILSMLPNEDGEITQTQFNEEFVNSWFEKIERYDKEDQEKILKHSLEWMKKQSF